eukprot:COSAG04_NODE_123_length_24709_cov_113.457294_18_plen_121_part_00
MAFRRCRGSSTGLIVQLEQCRRSTLLRALRAHVQQLAQRRHQARVSLESRRPRTKQRQLVQRPRRRLLQGIAAVLAASLVAGIEEEAVDEAVDESIALEHEPLVSVGDGHGHDPTQVVQE